MRIRVRFPYHTLDSDEPQGRVEFLGSDIAKPESDPSPAELVDAAQLLRRAGVTRVILVHGTFAGSDIVGLTREVARFSPTFAGHLNELGKRWFDDLVGELGNYTQPFADCFSNLINPKSLVKIPVDRFHWSGENHHLGRANAVMKLINQIATAQQGQRLLVLAHSHGGNVLAMLSQLLGANSEVRRRFFEATRLHYRSPIRGKIDLLNWQQARQWLLSDPAPTLPKIDVATFGTPLRYRWQCDICPKQLHFIQHRVCDENQAQRAILPGSIQDVMAARAGDYVQQAGIAGTDFLPSILAWRDWIVERRMHRMFEQKTRRRDVFTKLRRGRRASCDGTTLLVDYSDSDDRLNQKLFGHGVYTCRPWLPFHVRQIVNRFYRDSE